MSNSDELDLIAIAFRAALATPGPWWNDRALGNVIFSGQGRGTDIAVTEDFKNRADAEFIAAARNDVPQLVFALKIARSRIERATEIVDNVLSVGGGLPDLEDIETILRGND